MANPLTGDFDVVAEFAIPAANRVLAAMHRGERFPHSLTLRVDDSPARQELPLQFPVQRPIAVSLVDKYGAAAVARPAGPVLVAQAARTRTPILARDRALADLDLVVNDRPHPGLRLVQDYSHLHGTAQLQLSTPTISLPDQSGTRATVLISMMAQYFADADTLVLPRFLRGEIQINVGVDKVVSQVGSVVDINLKPTNVSVTFVPAYPPEQDPSLGTHKKNQINKMIRNSILTSFQPFNAPLPPSVKNMQFKGLTGGPAIALLLNTGDVSGDPASVDNIFLRAGDDFAFAASGGFILGIFSSFMDQLKALNISFTSTLADYSASIDSVTIELQDGQILLTVDGHAHTDSIFPDFSFTIRQALTLDLVDADGTLNGPVSTAQLSLVGDISLEIHRGGLAGAILNAFKNQAVNTVKQARNHAIAGLQPTVRSMLSADRNLGGFLKSLMNPVPKPGVQSQEVIDPSLEYTSFEITTLGIVLHGSLAVPEWPPVHAEIAVTSSDYNALNSWIPGGTIQQYTWAPPWQPPLPADPNTFVLPRTPNASGTRMCLTVKGTRISASGPIVQQDASATTCRWMSLPLTGRFERIEKDLPLVALTRATTSGAMEVTGHTSPSVPAGTQGSANLVIHCPDERSLADLESLSRALLESERTDATAILLAVLTPDQFAGIRATAGMIFTDDPDGAWERLLRVRRRPSTFLINASGAVVWWHEGELSSADLAAVFRTHLVPSGVSTPRLLEASVRVGQRPPNFIFEHAPEREMVLRKLTGRPVVLVFWKSSLKPCLETLRRLEGTMDKTGRRGPIVLAINDGEDPELARKAAAEHGPSAIVVPDPERQISLAYGVNLWPTIVFIDGLGLVSDIRYGVFSLDEAKNPWEAKAAAAP